MKIKIICFGKLDEQFYQLASQEYQKRISRFADLSILELKEATFNDEIKNQKVNHQNLINHLTKLKDYAVYFLDIQGPQIDSLKFAQLISAPENQQLCFVVGPSIGFDSEIKKLYPSLSFGPITMPHQLFRIVLLEQIYRSFKINNQQKYHK